MLKGDWGRCNHPKDHQGPLIGKQSDGSFQTAKAKIYPCGMNQIIGTAMFEFAVQFADCAIEADMPVDFAPYREQSCQESDIVQPDFHGS